MELRPECERCRAPLASDAAAYICVHECTFCPTCYRRLRFVCPNCSGELVRRPRSGPAGRPARPVVPPADNRIRVRRARPDDLRSISPLFDAYRQFYEQSPDARAAEQFLSDRLARGESVVFIAEEGEAPVGFMQLYPMFSSISLGRTYVLNDLFVPPTARRRGVGGLLLEAARVWGEHEGAHYLELSTAVDNPAQRVYEAHGWVPDREFLHYERRLGERAGPG